MRLAIKPNGTKIWEFRFTINGKRKETTFKTYPIVSLKDARNRREHTNSGINLIEHFE